MKNIYEEIYIDQDLYALCKVTPYTEEDHIHIESLTNEFRFNTSGVLQQKIIIEHHYKNYEAYLGWDKQWYRVWVDVPNESAISLGDK